MKRIAALFALVCIMSPAVWGAETVSGPKLVRLTVYNGNFALVKDTRTVSLVKGVNTVEVADVAAQIDPTSILFKSLTAPNSVSILEQNYRYDLMTPDNILSKSIGKRVTFTGFDANGKPYVQTGVLLFSVNNTSYQADEGYDVERNDIRLVVKTDDGKVVLYPEGQTSVESMPQGLYPKPTLNWMVQSDRDGSQDAQISYMTEGIGWKADYVALVDKNDASLDLSGWVTLNNQSGATYKNALLTLMAGDVRRIEEPNIRMAPKRSVAMVYNSAVSAPQFEEKSFFEYHMYSMERPTTIADNETKQLSLLTASGAAVKKDLVFDPAHGKKIRVVLEVKNSKGNRMGMPLPAGKIRVYKLDSDGNQQFIGEDKIDHTPKDEKIRLYIGDAFDIVGESKRIDSRKISKNITENTSQIEIRNHKNTTVTVKAIAHLQGSWKIIKTSHNYVKKDAWTVEFPVKVPANGSLKVVFMVRQS